MNLNKLEINLNHLRIALVYDRVNKWGGAERVLLALHKIFPMAPLFTSVYNKENTSWAHVFTVYPSFLNKLPNASASHEYLAPLMPLAFETLNSDKYDLVISVTSEAAKGIITKPSTRHICICLTPTRYLWSGYKEYFKNKIFTFFAYPFIWYLKTWDIMASSRPDSYIAISKTVKERIKKYYGRDSVVIYPPTSFTPCRSDLGISASPEPSFMRKENVKNERDYFLIVSRLVSYKKIDLAIKACNKVAVNLKIIGIGKELEKLKKISGDTIEFLGKVDEENLSTYYQNCKALIFPGVEDFGLVMVEAQLCGKPVIAFRGGGALEIIEEGKTGEFFNHESAACLAEALEKFSEKRYNRENCIKNAQKFSFETFKKALTRYIRSEVKG